MFRQRKSIFKESKSNSEEFDIVRGNDPKTLDKIKRLKEKWQTSRYLKLRQEASIMNAILLNPPTPMHVAVLSDNLPYFEENYKKSNPENLELFLIAAFLCGSRNIAEYLLKKCESSYITYTPSLAYIAASLNPEWAEEVANMLAQQNVPMVKDIYRLASDPMIDKIRAIFNKPRPPSSPPLSEAAEAFVTTGLFTPLKDSAVSTAPPDSLPPPPATESGAKAGNPR
jgi:hypothetical protein